VANLSLVYSILLLGL